ncbi:unnamed protein product [Prorocentrum cordatum]|uniref:Polycystin cation channel PKD1/PKD2 domain-containing protein n=1 Tax=Prorocentrum cordatum TaxID=2364126 RepID=A0ABN9W493_9DINO|nr:unnamed protein product [Polarella glacialis]
MMSVILVGLIMFAWMSFGERFRPCSSFGGAVVYCLDYLFGRFEFGPLYKADAVMASLFFYQYLLVCYVVFSNTLFAIIDRYFVTNDPPHVSLKRKLKPFFGRLLRFIEWDNDHTMVQDPQVKMEEGPPSRAKRVRDFAQRIALIRETGNVNAEGPMPSNKKAKGLPEVCDVDERMQQVLSWSRDEARKTVNAWSMMALEKEACKNEDVFIETVMRGKGGSREGIEAEELNARKDMEDAFRHIRYAREVHETMAQRDQRTLAQYITALEQSIQEEMVQESALRHEVVYLRGEAEKMASAPEETLDTASAAEDAPSQQQLEEGPDGDVQDPQRDGGESEDSYDNW